MLCQKKGKNFAKIDEEEDEITYVCRLCLHREKVETMRRIKHARDIFEIKKEWQKESEKAIASLLCKKCKGVVVQSFSTSQAAMVHGKRCECKTLRKRQCNIN